MSRYKKLRDTFRSLGIVDAFWYFCHATLHRLCESCTLDKYYVVAQSTSRTQRLLRDHGKSISMREISAGEPILAHIPRPSDIIAHRFAQGARCYGAFKDGILVGVIWLQTQEYREDEVRCAFSWWPKHDAVWSFDVFIVPEHRTGLAFVKLWSDVDAQLRQQGVRWTLSRISAFNVRSRASHQRLGLKIVAKCLFLASKKWQLMFSDCRPYIHLSRHAQSVPRITLTTPP
jgi:hypothetical protein